MSGNDDSKRIRQQMIDDAYNIIQDIQREGEKDRKKIHTIKAAALEHLDFAQSELQMVDDISATHRAELIREIGLAAQNGDFAEMQRLKKLLEKTSEKVN